MTTVFVMMMDMMMCMTDMFMRKLCHAKKSKLLSVRASS